MRGGRRETLGGVVGVLRVVLLEQLQDADDDVVDVAKSRCLRKEN